MLYNKLHCRKSFDEPVHPRQPSIFPAVSRNTYLAGRGAALPTPSAFPGSAWPICPQPSPLKQATPAVTGGGRPTQPLHDQWLGNVCVPCKVLITKQLRGNASPPLPGSAALTLNPYNLNPRPQNRPQSLGRGGGPPNHSRHPGEWLLNPQPLSPQNHLNQMKLNQPNKL